MTIINKQHYDPPIGQNYIKSGTSRISDGKTFSSAKIAGTIYKDAVKDGSTTKHLQLHYKSNGKQSNDNTPKLFNSGTGSAESVWYVYDNNGNAVSWTGIIVFGDIDSKENIIIDKNCVIEELYKGSMLTKDTLTSGDIRYKSSQTNDNSKTNSVFLKVSIPTSGMSVKHFTSDAALGLNLDVTKYEGILNEAVAGSWNSI